VDDRVFMMDFLSNHSLRIWIAEDEDELREALGKSLSREGREILLFADGKELLQHLKRSPAFDIIIADLLMPEVDGLQVLQESKACNPDGIVIIMTGYASLDTAIQAIRGGAYDYIRKPFKLDEIELVVKNAGEKIALVRENRRLLQRLKDTMEEIREIRKPPVPAPDAREARSSADLDQDLSGMDVLLKQMIPSDYDFKDREHREKTYQEIKKLIEYKKEGLLNEGEFLSMKNLLLKSLRP
jgi:DNA-binding response OmpR family regulator